MIVDEWAAAWGIPAEVIADLRHRVLNDVGDRFDAAPNFTSEAGAQAHIRFAACGDGARLLRNNVGAGKLIGENGNVSFVRWGLANDSKAVNARMKSGDLIGIRPVLIESRHVGRTFGQFCSREMKHVGWKYNPNDPHEQAQMRWADFVNALGGDAKFSQGEWL